MSGERSVPILWQEIRSNYSDLDAASNGSKIRKAVCVCLSVGLSVCLAFLSVFLQHCCEDSAANSGFGKRLKYFFGASTIAE